MTQEELDKIVEQHSIGSKRTAKAGKKSPGRTEAKVYKYKMDRGGMKKKGYELDPVTHAIVIRNRELSRVKLLHGDKFTGRFLCSLWEIACYAKKLMLNQFNNKDFHPHLVKGVSDSLILSDSPYYHGENMSIVIPIMEKLKNAFEPYRIRESLWKDCYLFTDFREMIIKCFEITETEAK